MTSQEPPQDLPVVPLPATPEQALSDIQTYSNSVDEAYWNHDSEGMINALAHLWAALVVLKDA
jgi:hypothetical protein